MRIILILLLMCSCATIPYNDFRYDQEELDKVIKNNNLDERSIMIINKTKKDLAIAEKQQKENRQLEKEIIKESKLVGMGKMAYMMICLGVFGIIAFIIYKIIK